MSGTGTVETEPKTDEDWAKVRHGAVALVEASNLLIVPGRHVARPGEKSEAPGVELEPADMEALILKDIPGWRGRAKALHEAGLATLKAVDARDPHPLTLSAIWAASVSGGVRAARQRALALHSSDGSGRTAEQLR